MTERIGFAARMPVERGKIREYALATGSHQPGYLQAARPPIPPTFLSTVIFWDDFSELTRRPEVDQLCAQAGVAQDYASLLSLEQEYVFHGPLPRAGDELEVHHRFDGVESKNGRTGTMVLVHFALEFRAPDGDLRAECLYTSAFVNPAGVGGAA